MGGFTDDLLATSALSPIEGGDDGEGARVHSRFAPSSLKRVLECPRSVWLSETVLGPNPPRRSSVWAAEGSVAHLVAEEYARSTPTKAPNINSTVVLDGHSITVDTDMHNHAAAYAVYVRGLMVPGDVLYIETTVRLDAIVGPQANMYGHLDAAIWSPSRRLLIIIDYKYGRGIRVLALDNPQMKAYALGAMYSVGDIDPDDVDKIEMHVYQPRVSGKTAPAVESAVDLLMWGHEELAPIIHEIEKDGAASRAFVTGEHCRFCPALAQCPAMRERAVNAARKAFGASPVAPQALSDAEIGAACSEADVIDPWLEAVRAEGLKRAIAGATVAGHKVVLGKSSRVWKDTKDVIAVLDEMGIRSPDTYEEKFKSVAQMEKLVKERGIDDDTQFRALWEYKPGNRALVPASDPRPSVRTGTAADVFSEVPLSDDQEPF